MRVRERLTGKREVDDHVGAVEHVPELRCQRRVGLAAELQPIGCLDGVADRGAHPPGGPGDGDSNRIGHQAASAGLTGATALRKQSPSAPMQAAEMFSAA